VNHRALDDALEARGRLSVVSPIRDQIFKFRFEIIHQARAQLVEVDAAGTHHGRRIGVVNQRQQEMFERRVLVMSLIGNRQRTMQGLLKALGKSRHSRSCGPLPS
jgi:hypothetical protein